MMLFQNQDFGEYPTHPARLCKTRIMKIMSVTQAILLFGRDYSNLPQAALINRNTPNQKKYNIITCNHRLMHENTVFILFTHRLQ